MTRPRVSAESPRGPDFALAQEPKAFQVLLEKQALIGEWFSGHGKDSLRTFFQEGASADDIAEGLRAFGALASAQLLLCKWIAKIGDPEKARIFLEQMVAHDVSIGSRAIDELDAIEQGVRLLAGLRASPQRPSDGR